MVWEERGWTTTVDKETGEILTKAKVLKQDLKVKVPVAPEENPQETARNEAGLESTTSKRFR